MPATNNHPDAPAQARVVVIGVLQVNEQTELRFVKEPWGWRPDLIVNHETEQVSNPPSCFTPTDEVIEALDLAYLEFVGDPLLRLMREGGEN